MDPVGGVKEENEKYSKKQNKNIKRRKLQQSTNRSSREERTETVNWRKSVKKKIEENVLESGHLNIHIEKTKCSAEQAGKVSQ